MRAQAARRDTAGWQAGHGDGVVGRARPRGRLALDAGERGAVAAVEVVRVEAKEGGEGQLAPQVRLADPPAAALAAAALAAAALAALAAEVGVEVGVAEHARVQQPRQRRRHASDELRQLAALRGGGVGARAAARGREGPRQAEPTAGEVCGKLRRCENRRDGKHLACQPHKLHVGCDAGAHMAREPRLGAPEREEVAVLALGQQEADVLSCELQDGGGGGSAPSARARSSLAAAITCTMVWRSRSRARRARREESGGERGSRADGKSIPSCSCILREKKSERAL